MARVKLTPDRIRKYSCEAGKQSFLWDETVPGLGVRATSGGKKTYILQSRFAGKAIRITIGDVGAWLLESKDPESPGARQEARRLIALIDQGIDPREQKREQEQQQRAAKAAREKASSAEQISKKTIADLWTEYLGDRKPQWGDLHYQDHIRLAQTGGDKVKRGTRKKKPGPLAPLMSVTLSSFSTEVIDSWLTKETKDRPTQAKLAFRIFRAFLGWCGEHKEYGELIGPHFITKRTTEVLPKTKAKFDGLQKEQISLWFIAVGELDNPVMSVYLKGLLLTGARRRELTPLKWSDIDFRWKSITIHDKVEGERIIPLTPHLEGLLKWLPKRNEFVFSSPTAQSGHIEAPTRAHQRALTAAGLEGISLHGLRRSFGSLAEWVELPSGVVAQIMGHKPSATAEKHYRVRPLDLLRTWHVKYESWILEQAGIVPPVKDAEIQQLKLVTVNKE